MTADNLRKVLCCPIKIVLCVCFFKLFNLLCILILIRNAGTHLRFISFFRFQSSIQLLRLFGTMVPQRSTVDAEIPEPPKLPFTL